MFKIVYIVVFLLALLGCTSSPNVKKTATVKHTPLATDVTLSHVKAYLLVGNIPKAEQVFHTITPKEMNAQSLLVLAELHAAKGNSIDAQQVFLTALADSQFASALNKNSIPVALLDYFCEQKKWPALQGYGAAMIDAVKNDGAKLASENIIKNETFTKIGLCFFDQQKWDDTTYWLDLVDLTKQLNPLVYLALARANIEQQQYSVAQSFISRYEQQKDAVDPQSLWLSIEVYLALKQPDKVTQVGNTMRSLFPYNAYTRKYILLTKRGRIEPIMDSPIPSPTETTSSPANDKAPSDQIHIIQKGETLYQLSKRYGVTAPELMAWNPDVVVDDIALGTPIRIMAPKTRFEND